MIRLFLASPPDEITPSALDRVLAMNHGLITLTCSNDLADWLDDVHPNEPAIVITFGDAAAFYAAEVERLRMHERCCAAAFLAVDCAALTHPLRSYAPALFGLHDPKRPPMPSFIASAIGGEASAFGRVRAVEGWDTVNVWDCTPQAQAEAIARVVRQTSNRASFGARVDPPTKSRLAVIPFLPPVEA